MLWAFSTSRLALLAEPLVQGCYGVRKIQRPVSRTMIFEEVQLAEEIECRRSEVETLINAGWPARNDSAHEALRPRQIVSSNRRIGFDVIGEPLAGRGAQADDSCRWRLRLKRLPCVGCENGSQG